MLDWQHCWLGYSLPSEILERIERHLEQEHVTLHVQEAAENDVQMNGIGDEGDSSDEESNNSP